MARKWRSGEDAFDDGFGVARDDGSCKRYFYIRDYGSYSEANRAAEDYYLKLQAMDEPRKVLLEAEKRKRQEEKRKKAEEFEKRRNSSSSRPTPPTKKCTNCGESLWDDSPFCPHCGVKREKCCGEFINAGIRFCPKCGKPTLEEFKRLAEEKQRAEEERIAEQKRQDELKIAELKRFAEEKRRQEEAKQLEEQRKKDEQMMRDPNNYIDRGDYIELVYPIGNIRMIQKDYVKQKGFLLSKKVFSWNEAIKFTKELCIGGFSDWRLPTKEELKMIYKIKDICGIDNLNMFFWSSSPADRNYNFYYCVHFVNGICSSLAKIKHLGSVRCVR